MGVHSFTATQSNMDVRRMSRECLQQNVNNSYDASKELNNRQDRDAVRTKALARGQRMASISSVRRAFDELDELDPHPCQEEITADRETRAILEFCHVKLTVERDAKGWTDSTLSMVARMVPDLPASQRDEITTILCNPTVKWSPPFDIHHLRWWVPAVSTLIVTLPSSFGIPVRNTLKAVCDDIQARGDVDTRRVQGKRRRTTLVNCHIENLLQMLVDLRGLLQPNEPVGKMTDVASRTEAQRMVDQLSTAACERIATLVGRITDFKSYIEQDTEAMLRNLAAKKRPWAMSLHDIMATVVG